MPYTLKTQQISVKDPDSGEYIGVDVLTEQTKEGLIAELQAEGNTQVARINQAAVDVQSAVDQAEIEAQQLISSTQSSLNTLETQKDTIAQTVASMAELGTDTTLTTAGMAADAKATGDEISNVKNALTLQGFDDGAIFTPAIVFNNGTYYKAELQTGSSNSYKSVQFDISPYDDCEISFEVDYANDFIRSGLMDSEGNPITVWTGEEVSFIKPTNAKYLCLSCLASFAQTVSIKKLTKNRKQLTENVNVNIPFEYTYKKAYDTDLEIISNDYAIAGKADVSGLIGKTIIVQSYMLIGHACGFVDGEGNKISEWHGDANREKTIVVPDDSKYLLVSSAMNNSQLELKATYVYEIPQRVESLYFDASVSDEGKVLKAKTVTNGKVSEWEFGESIEIDDTISESGKAADAEVTGVGLKSGAPKSPDSGIVLGILGDCMSSNSESYYSYWDTVADRLCIDKMTIKNYATGTNKAADQKTQALKLTGVNYTIIMVGTYDFAGNVTLNDFTANITELIRNMRYVNPKMRAVFVTPPQRFDKTTNTLGLYLADYVKKIIDTCSQLNIPVLDIYNTGLISSTNYTKYLISNGLHFSEEGGKLVGETVANYISEHLEQRYPEIKITKPDEKLSFQTGFAYHVNYSQVIVENNVSVSNFVEVKTGDTVHVTAKNVSDGYYLIAAFDENMIWLPSKSQTRTTTYYYSAYEVPAGVKYIRISTAPSYTAYAEVLSKPYFNHLDNLDRMKLLSDIHDVRWFVGGNSTTYGIHVEGSGANITNYGMIPLDFIYAISFDAENYSMALTYFNDSFETISTGTITTGLHFGWNSAIPSSAKYIQIRLTATDTEETITGIDQTGLRIISKNNITDSEVIAGYESQKLKYVDKDTFKNSYCVSKPSTELMAHTSNVYDGEDGYLYIPYYANETSYVEGFAAPIISRVAKVSQCNLNNVEIIDTAEAGQDFVNFVQDSDHAPYDALFMKKDETTFSFNFVAYPADGTACIAVREFDMETATASAEAEISTFEYEIDGTSYSVPMDIENLSVFVNRIVGDEQNTHDIGAYPILTRACYYDGAYYSYLGGLQLQNGDTGFGGCIVKTEDYGHTWELVAYNDNMTGYITCMWEGAIDISSEGKAYCLLRAFYYDPEVGSSYYPADIAMYYDIVNDQWSDMYHTDGADANNKPYDYYLSESGSFSPYSTDSSRTFVYCKGDYVYLMFNVQPRLNTKWKTSGVIRSAIRIWKCDSELNPIAKKTYQSDAGISYFSCVNANGREYFCFSEDRRHKQNDCKGNIAIIQMNSDFLP